MKIIFLLSLLLCISFAFAQDNTSLDNRYPYPCGSYNCNYGHVCLTSGDDCRCIPEPDCRDVTLEIRFIGRWTDGSRGDRVYSQYDVIVHNNSNRTVKNVYIGTGFNFRLRDGNAIWNANLLPYGVLSLTQSINAGASFTFGFIIHGGNAPNLRILGVTY